MTTETELARKNNCDESEMSRPETSNSNQLSLRTGVELQSIFRKIHTKGFSLEDKDHNSKAEKLQFQRDLPG